MQLPQSIIGRFRSIDNTYVIDGQQPSNYMNIEQIYLERNVRKFEFEIKYRKFTWGKCMGACGVGDRCKMNY